MKEYKEQKKEYDRKHYKAHPGVGRVADRKKRARKMNAIGSHTNGEWETLKAQYNWTCPHCGREEPETKLTEDHIIPLSKGGSDNIENIQPLCGKGNSEKHTKSTKYVIKK